MLSGSPICDLDGTPLGPACHPSPRPAGPGPGVPQILPPSPSTELTLGPGPTRSRRTRKGPTKDHERTPERRRAPDVGRPARATRAETRGGVGAQRRQSRLDSDRGPARGDARTKRSSCRDVRRQ